MLFRSDYAEDDAGGLMNTRYSRLRPGMTVGEAISYLRRDAQNRARTAYYAYVVDAEERLLGVITYRDLIVAPADKSIGEVMRTQIISAREDMDQEALGKLFMRHHLLMIRLHQYHQIQLLLILLPPIVTLGKTASGKHHRHQQNHPAGNQHQQLHGHRQSHRHQHPIGGLAFVS